MDNASKALVMAGAILIAVMLISLGVLVFNQVSTNIGNMSDLETKVVEAHNKEFLNYVGINQSVSDVKNLISAINAFNLSKDGNEYGRITVTGTGITGSTSNGFLINEQTAKPGWYYRIEIQSYYGPSATNGKPGCIQNMKVTGQSTMTSVN